MFSRGFRTAARSSCSRSAHHAGQLSALSTSSLTSAFQPTVQPTSNAKRNQSTLAPLRRDPPREVLAPVYVHHISKTVLQHLQSECYEWLQQTGLNRGLRLNANGTFVLQFPERKGHDEGRIWCVIFACLLSCGCILDFFRRRTKAERFSHGCRTTVSARRILTFVLFNAIVRNLCVREQQDEFRCCHETALVVRLPRKDEVSFLVERFLYGCRNSR